MYTCSSDNQENNKNNFNKLHTKKVLKKRLNLHALYHSHIGQDTLKRNESIFNYHTLVKKGIQVKKKSK